MPFADPLEEMADLIGRLVQASEAYRAEIRQMNESARGEDHSDKTMHIWSWQVSAAENFADLLMDEVHPEFIRMAEQDYILRRSDVDDILV